MMLGSVRQPEILRQQLEENLARLNLRIPPDLAYFAGHFPGMPIVPGVVQLHWVVGYATGLFKLNGPVTIASQIKFNNLMQPSDEICLSLEYNPDTLAVSYSYKADEKSYSSGRLTFAQVVS